MTCLLFRARVFAFGCLCACRCRTACVQSGCPARCGVKPLLIPFVLRAQSLDPGVQLSWGSSTYSADEVKNSWGTTFGGSGTNGACGASGSFVMNVTLALFKVFVPGRYLNESDPSVKNVRASPSQPSPRRLGT